MPSDNCIYTTIRNTSGYTRSFGFAGRHGRRLAPGEQFTVRGNIANQIDDHYRKFDGLNRALESGAIAIVETPAVHLYSDTPILDITKILVLNGGTLGTVDPCWGSYSSSATIEPGESSSSSLPLELSSSSSLPLELSSSSSLPA